jgi:hypothetical protein
MAVTSLTTTPRAAVPPRPGPVSWRPGQDLELAQWLEHGRRFGLLGRNVAWWIGDWLVYGNERYGERYPRAAKVTGYDAQSLMNMAWVASRFDPSRRREGLSWSHHAEVASLPQPEQDTWLDQCETQRMSVHCLRIELRASLRAGRGPKPKQSPTLVCPKCGDSIPLRGPH